VATGFVTPGTPNLPDFLTFLAGLQIPSAALPSNSAFPGYALNQAIALVNNPPGVVLPDPVMYSLACYNCATHLLILITPDQPGQTWFATSRGNNPTSTPPGFGLNTISQGLVASSSDNGTSSTLASPDWAKGLTIGQLGFMKTPWGRRYLDWNQSFGPTIVGLT
jgi:hypothetical protein